MINEKYTSLLDRLIFKTEKGELEWKESVFPDAFQLSFPNYSLTISQKVRDQELDYVISIIGSNGNTIDTFSDVDLGGDYFSRMDALYHSARRQALGVDKALDEILEDLGSPF